MKSSTGSDLKRYLLSVSAVNYALIAFYIATIFILLLISNLSILIQANSLPELSVKNIESISLPILDTTISSVSARSYAVYDVSSRTFLKTSNSTLRFSPASTTKIMTALVALEAYRLSDILDTIEGRTAEGSKMGIYEGEKLRVLDLMYGLLLPSGNDAAYVLASNYPGGITAFIKRMNEKAHELYMFNTYFTDPSGFDDRNYTTAQDLARLSAYALQNPTIREIIKTKNISFTDPTGNFIHKIANLNKLLDVEGVTGMKTGYTDEAGGVLITTLHDKNRDYVFVVLKSDDRFADTLVLMNAVKSSNMKTF